VLFQTAVDSAAQALVGDRSAAAPTGWPGRAPTRRALVQREAPARVSGTSQAHGAFLRKFLALFTLRGFAALQPRPHMLGCALREDYYRRFRLRGDRPVMIDGPVGRDDRKFITRSDDDYIHAARDLHHRTEQKTKPADKETARGEVPAGCFVRVIILFAAVALTAWGAWRPSGRLREMRDPSPSSCGPPSGRPAVRPGWRFLLHQRRRPRRD
jgi:hypothetical protein